MSIIYKYPQSEWIRLNEGTDWTLETIKTVTGASRIYLDVTRHRYKQINGEYVFSESRVIRTNFPIFGFVTLLLPTKPFDNQTFAFSDGIPLTQKIGVLRIPPDDPKAIPTFGNTHTPTSLTRSGSGYLVANSGENYVFSGNYSEQQKCKFTVFDENKEIIYSELQDVCPEVKKIGKECPDDTCKVICGNTVCCYNSEGISVESFLAN